MKLLLATNNRNKQREIQQILDEMKPSSIDVVLPQDVLGYNYDVLEDGAGLEENAFKKASTFYSLTNIPSFADDTGLEIDFLGGKPGVHSARFAGNDCNDANNRKKVLDLMKNVRDSLRNARFRTVICYVDSSGSHFIEGVCYGKITEFERGVNGFGYDSIFLPNGFDKTFAEMSAEEKNNISHRRKAVENLYRFLVDKLDK